MKATEFRTLIKESIQEYIKEIDAAGNRAALEAKMEKTKEAIESRKKKINMEGLDEAYHDMMDKGKIKELTSEIKLLEKSLTKYGKMLEKMDAKDAPKMEEMKDDNVEEEVIDEVSIDETFPESGAQLEEEELTPEESEELRKKAEHYHKEYSIAEAKKKMTAAQKEKKEDIVKGMKKSKSFGKSKEEKAKMYATATKLATKESVETEDEVLNESFLHMQKLAGLITEAEYQKKKKILTEALNKDIRQFGQDLEKRLKEAGFSTIVVFHPKTISDQQLAEIKSDPKKVGLHIILDQQYQGLQLRGNAKSAKELEKIINKFQVSNWNGPKMEFGSGWDTKIKQVIGGFNPGDIVGGGKGVNGVYYDANFTRYAVTQSKTTTDQGGKITKSQGVTQTMAK